MSASPIEPEVSSADVAVLFGASLKEARKQAGLTQEQVAMAAGLHRTEIGLLERGQRTPRATTIMKLAGAVGVEPGELFRNLRWLPHDDQEGGRYIRS